MGNQSAKPLPGIVTRTQSPVLRVFHSMIAAAGWILFAWFWFHVFWSGLGREAITTFVILAIALAGILLIHLLWIRSNLEIYRSRGQRTRVREVSFAGTRDQLGRPLLDADWDRLRQSAWIVIDIDTKTQTKIYRTAGTIQSPGDTHV